MPFPMPRTTSPRGMWDFIMTLFGYHPTIHGLINYGFSSDPIEQNNRFVSLTVRLSAWRSVMPSGLTCTKIGKGPGMPFAEWWCLVDIDVQPRLAF